MKTFLIIAGIVILAAYLSIGMFLTAMSSVSGGRGYPARAIVLWPYYVITGR